jgi:hypothetical protein
MALILAIESDRRQINHLTAMVRGKLRAELVLGDTAEAALERLGNRIPDLILTSPLLSPRDEQALSDRLRKLNGVAAHVQTLTLPMFAPPNHASAPARGGVLSALLGDRSSESATDGCDPAVFAEQCREYLSRSEAERDEHEELIVAEAPKGPEAPTAPEAPEVSALLHFADDPTSILAAVAAVEPDAVQEPDDQPDDDFVDVDLSELLEVEAEAAEDEEPAVYDLSAEEPAEPASDDFEDWEQVVESLKREGRRIQLPRTKQPVAPVARARPVQAKAPQDETAPDEFGVYDPKLAGMAALFAKLEELSEDDEQPA